VTWTRKIATLTAIPLKTETIPFRGRSQRETAPIISRIQRLMLGRRTSEELSNGRTPPLPPFLYLVARHHVALAHGRGHLGSCHRRCVDGGSHCLLCAG